MKTKEEIARLSGYSSKTIGRLLSLGKIRSYEGLVDENEFALYIKESKRKKENGRKTMKNIISHEIRIHNKKKELAEYFRQDSK